VSGSGPSSVVCGVCVFIARTRGFWNVDLSSKSRGGDNQPSGEEDFSSFQPVARSVPQLIPRPLRVTSVAAV
jgi:hypothetical protein